MQLRDTKRIAKRRFILDGSLVLYLPLWHPELGGGTIVSRDGRRHVCTVTEAVFGAKGRTFDGVDDKITVATSPLFVLSNAFSVIVWLQTPATLRTSDTVIQIGNSGVQTGIAFNLGQNNAGAADADSVGAWVNGAVSGWIVAGITNDFMIASTWYMFGLTYNKVNLTVWRNNGAATPVAFNESIVAFDVSPVVWLGQGLDGAESCQMVLGEVWIYNRGLSSIEMKRLYDATKWKYLI